MNQPGVNKRVLFYEYSYPESIQADETINDEVKSQWSVDENNWFYDSEMKYCDLFRANQLYSAEVSIGLTEGLVHADYMDEGEVYHTILHEIGHAVGLGHSPFKKDIMYTPHQKGITHVGQGDRLSVNWLYTFPQGKTVAEIASKYGVSGSDLDEVVARIISKQAKTEFEKVKDTVKVEPSRNLLDESENIANLRKYHMSLQNIKISGDLTEQIRKHYRDSNIKKD